MVMSNAPKASLERMRTFGQPKLACFGTVIDERDAYMARTLWAAATGAPGASPAFVADSTHDGRCVFRYAMPPGAPGGFCNAGALPRPTCSCPAIS